jgi:hypothetical protein
MWNRVSWSAVAALVFLCGAFACAGLDEPVFALVFGLGAICWAILSTKEGS